ncbi:hypothetical protein [Pyrobaculum sp.]|uniref:hypothetical protein n=1 Tax=Pyrobaculum sp. TaxID=2004705 RepID=UPI003D11F578
MWFGDVGKAAYMVKSLRQSKSCFEDVKRELGIDMVLVTCVEVEKRCRGRRRRHFRDRGRRSGTC